MRSGCGVSAFAGLSLPLGWPLCRPLVAASGLAAFVAQVAQDWGRPYVQIHVQGCAQSVCVRVHSDPFNSCPGGS